MRTPQRDLSRRLIRTPGPESADRDDPAPAGDAGEERQMPTGVMRALRVLLVIAGAVVVVRNFFDWGQVVPAVALGVAALVAVTRVLLVKEERLVWSICAIGLTAQTGPTLFYIVYSDAAITFPSVPDAMALTFFIASLASAVLLIRSRLHDRRRSLWLDGVIGGLAVSAVISLLVFRTALSGSGVASQIVHGQLGYAIADVFILGFLGAVALLGGWHFGPAGWAFVLAFSLSAIGDSMFVAAVADGTLFPSTLMTSLWAAGPLTLAAAATTRRRVASAGSEAGIVPVALLGASATSALCLLLAYGFGVSGETPALTALAGAVLGVTVVRFCLSLLDNSRLLEASHDRVLYAASLQLTETEEAASDLLRRHIERSVSGSSVVVLLSDTTADQLGAGTELPDDSPLHARVAAAKALSCLAVRQGATHAADPRHECLVDCDVCGALDGGLFTCEPLVVSGVVIGSVLVRHRDPLNEHELRAIKEAVAQTAPVLATLRTLAIAEYHAATDALTGMPNSRAVRDTFKRMVAQAARSQTSLAAVLVDLDHFKLVNDTYGHAVGDDVLATVGPLLQESVRSSDFAGRYGGEEFLILLPDTTAEDAAAVAEKIRRRIELTVILGVPRRVTASFGVSALPANASTSATLLLTADEALYAAKSNGRNRVEIAARMAADEHGRTSPAQTASP